MASNDPFQNIVIGYPKLAAKIEIQPESAMYRRFGALNAQNLLYFQAELTDLEEKLRDQQLLDHNQAKGSKSLYARNWFRLQDSEIDGDTEQLDLVLKIREVLKDYSTYEHFIEQDLFTFSSLIRRSRFDPTISHSQLSQAREMGSPPSTKLPSNPADGPTCLDWRGCDSVGLGSRSQVSRTRSCHSSASCKEGRVFCLGCRKHNLQPFEMRLYAVYETFSRSWRSRLRRQYHLSNHVLDYQHSGLPDTNSINCGTLLRAFDACEIRHHCSVQCADLRMFNGAR